MKEKRVTVLMIGRRVVLLKHKGEVSHKEWRYEVQCLGNDPEVKGA